MELVLRPDALKPLIENWEEVAGWLVARVRAEAMLEGASNEAASLLTWLLELPGVAEIPQVPHPEGMQLLVGYLASVRNGWEGDDAPTHLREMLVARTLCSRVKYAKSMPRWRLP